MAREVALVALVASLLVQPTMVAIAMATSTAAADVPQRLLTVEIYQKTMMV